MSKTDQQKAAEAEVEKFRQALGPFVTAADTTRMPMMFTDAKSGNHPIIYTNQAFLNLSGYDEHEVIGQSFDFLMQQGTDPEMLEEIRASYLGARDLEPLVPYRRKDGTSAWLMIFITPVRDETGDVVQHFSSFVNVTAHKEEQGRLHSLLKSESS